VALWRLWPALRQAWPDLQEWQVQVPKGADDVQRLVQGMRTVCAQDHRLVHLACHTEICGKLQHISMGAGLPTAQMSAASMS
jgi:hypothetical protein